MAATVIGLVGFLNHDAFAITYDIHDQASCESLPSGSPSWNSVAGICTVTNVSLTLNNGDLLSIECCYTLTTNGGSIVINSGGILSDHGNFQNMAGNAGVVTSANITNHGQIILAGSFNNNGPLYNTGNITISKGISDSGTITNLGIINNMGTIFSGGNITNYGTINSYGSINVGTITNSGVITSYKGDINLGSKLAKIKNEPDGIIINKAGSDISNDGTIINQGNIVNNGTITLPDTIIFGGSTSGVPISIIENDNRIENNPGGKIILRGFANLINNPHGKISNSGTIENGSLYGSLIDNSGIIKNNLGGIIHNYSQGTINNNGRINNKSGADVENFGIVNNQHHIVNGGIINNHCTATITGKPVKNVAAGTLNNVCP